MNKTMLTIFSSCMFAMAINLHGGETKNADKENLGEQLIQTAMKANEIAFSFYRQKAAGKQENFFFSPYSMRSAFAMAREGAKGKTAAEVDKVFSFPSENAEMRLEMRSMAESAAQAAKGSEFSDANSFWADISHKFLPEYVSSLTENYHAAAENADFANDTEGARKKINSWTSSKTSGLIKDLFAEGSLSPDTKLVLVNAVYFKGMWQDAFNKRDSFESGFTLNSGKKAKTMFMRHTEAVKFPYYQTEDAQYLSMPYKGSHSSQNGLEMMIILPNDVLSFAKTEKMLSPKHIHEIRKRMQYEKVRVFLPKFTFSSSNELNAALKAMGMPLAFSNFADFSGMTGKKDLKIGYAIQKAFIDVSEEGTEAAAATGISESFTAALPIAPVIFRADRPFIFLIRDIKTGLIFFMGKLEKPTA